MKQDKMMRICTSAKVNICSCTNICPLAQPHDDCDNTFHYKMARADDSLCGACSEVEPQPATCPDCGHPVHKGQCQFKNSIGYCVCKRTPTDLQHRDDWSQKVVEQLNPHATTGADMLNDKEFMSGIEKGLQDFRDGKIRSWDDIKKELGLVTFTSVELEAHDSAIAAQARREFADELCRRLPQCGFCEEAGGCKKIIRAMAKKEGWRC